MAKFILIFAVFTALSSIVFVRCKVGVPAQNQSVNNLPVSLGLDSLAYRVEPAPDWTSLFYRKSGWFGADGIFSIPLDGNDHNDGSEETMIIFSDTYIGEVSNDQPLPGNTMVNNTVAYFRGLVPSSENISFYYKKKENGAPETFFVPKQIAGNRAQHFWLGDGFMNPSASGQIYIFAYHVEVTGPNVFDFIEPEVSLIKIAAKSKPPFDNYQVIPTPLHIKSPKLGEGNFGAGIFVNTKWAGEPKADGYIYIYGCLGQDKNLIAARVKANAFEKFEKWTFWNGRSWSENRVELASITNAVSNELSVTSLKDGRYLLTFQVLGISDKVGIRIGSSPVGPFGPIQEIYVTPEMTEGLWPYNAKAHPALSSPGELLISYNTITPDFWNDIQKNAHIYRPRFIKMIFE